MAMNKNRVIELCLVFLVSILSFSIGTFVGKKYSDNQHRLAILDPNYKHDLNTAADGGATALSSSTSHETTSEGGTTVGDDAHALKAAITDSKPLSDSDVAKMNAELSADEDAAGDTVKGDTNVVKTINEDGTAADETPVKSKAKSKKTAALNGPNVVREVANISEKAKSITQDEKGLDGTTHYTVQVGAFPSPTEADKIVNSLQARGYKANYISATVNGKTWYRVQVGLFTSLQEAQIYKKELVEQNHLTSAIIQRVSK